MNHSLKNHAPLLVAYQQDTPAAYDETTSATHPILIVSDDPHMLKLMAGTLEDAGYTVAAVASGWEAVQWIQAARAVGELPALILLDLALPGICRSQMAEALRQPGRGVVEPIIVTSAMQPTHPRA